MNDQTKQAMQMALEALEQRENLSPKLYDYVTTALREALAQPQDMKECRHCGWLCKPNDAPSKKGYVLAQPQGEPFAWAYIDADGSFMDALDRQHGAYQTPLYTTSPVVPQVAPDGRVAKTVFTLEDVQKAVEMGRDAGIAEAEALAQPQGEPVAWKDFVSKAHDVDGHCDVVLVSDLKRCTTPPVVPQGDDDLTIAYMVGYEKGKDYMKEKAACLREQIALQGVQSSWYEDGFWDGLVAYEQAIRSMK